MAVVVALTALARLTASINSLPTPHQPESEVLPPADSLSGDATPTPPPPTEFIVGEPSVPDIGPDVSSLPTVSPRDDEPSEINPRQDPRQR